MFSAHNCNLCAKEILAPKNTRACPMAQEDLF